MTTLPFRRPTPVMINGLVELIEPETATVLAWIVSMPDIRTWIVFWFAQYYQVSDQVTRVAIIWIWERTIWNETVGKWWGQVVYQSAWWGLCQVKTGVVI